MSARAIPLIFTLTLLTAGCVGLDLESGDVEDPLGVLTARAEPLWHDPQNAPHPAFNYPTLTNPPEGEDVPAWWAPIPPGELPDAITGLAHHGGTGGDVITHGAGIALFGSLAVVPGYDGASVVDISDPADPRVLSRIELSTRGAAMMPLPDGRLLTVLATAANILVYDITDPQTPLELPSLDPATGSHKVGVVPGTPLVYNANSAGGGGPPDALDPETATGQTEIFDLSDPENPVLVQEFQNGYGCHHVFFHVNPAEDRYHAVCAGVEVTQIWDITDPRNPEVLVNVPVHHGRSDLPPVSYAPARFSHFAILNADATVLIVGDETTGGAGPACDAHVDTPAGSASGPLGNLYFYDVTDMQNPELKSWISPSAHFVENPIVGGCTAHHGRLVPDPEGRDLLAHAFNAAGVLLIDFTDLTHPRIVDQWADGANPWEVWYYNGYLFTGDRNRGFDVLKFT